MTSIHRVRVGWTGFPGGPGVSTFYTLDTAGFLDDLYTFFYALRGAIPTSVTIQIEGTGDTITDTTGELVSGWTEDAPAAIDCNNSNTYAAPSGAVVDWLTSAVLDGRRLRGRTFLVPVAADAYETNGTLHPDFIAMLQGVSDAFVAAQSGSFVIWHRPRAAKAADGSRKAVTQRDGGHSLVTAAHVPDEACVLRSRRD